MVSGPITSWQIDGETVEMVRLYFVGSKITADGDCSHEIKRLFLLGRKVMNNLLLLLSRFSGQPRQHIKKQRRYVADSGPSSLSFCFPSIWTVVLETTLESPLDCEEIQLVHPKGIQSWIFIGRTDAEAETLTLWSPDVKNWLIWKDPDSGRDWGQEEKGRT